MIASQFDAFLFFFFELDFFELDGVIYLGEGSLPGAVKALAGLRAPAWPRCPGWYASSTPPGPRPTCLTRV